MIAAINPNMVSAGALASNLSIVVTWRDRSELGRSIRSLTRCAERHGGNLIVVNYGGSIEQLSALLRGTSTSVTIATVRGQRWFNKARAQNIGAAHAASQLLFFCDGDILID